MHYFISSGLFGGFRIPIQALMLLYIPIYGGILYKYRGTGYAGLVKSLLWMILPAWLVFISAIRDDCRTDVSIHARHADHCGSKGLVSCTESIITLYNLEYFHNRTGRTYSGIVLAATFFTIPDGTFTGNVFLRQRKLYTADTTRLPVI